jgi:hypothetical protein
MHDTYGLQIKLQLGRTPSIVQCPLSAVRRIDLFPQLPLFLVSYLGSCLPDTDW